MAEQNTVKVYLIFLPDDPSLFAWAARI